MEYFRDGLTLSSATAIDLDRLAEMVGIERGTSTVAFNNSTLNVQIYVNPNSDETADTLAAAISEARLTIPQGTKISNGAMVAGWYF